MVALAHQARPKLAAAVVTDSPATDANWNCVRPTSAKTMANVSMEPNCFTSRDANASPDLLVRAVNTRTVTSTTIRASMEANVKTAMRSVLKSHAFASIITLANTAIIKIVRASRTVETMAHVFRVLSNIPKLLATVQKATRARIANWKHVTAITLSAKMEENVKTATNTITRPRADAKTAFQDRHAKIIKWRIVRAKLTVATMANAIRARSIIRVPTASATLVTVATTAKLNCVRMSTSA